MNVKKWILNRTKPFFPHVFLVSLLHAVVSVSYVYLATISRDVIDISIESTQNKIIFSAVILFGTLIFQIIVESLLALLEVRLNGKAVNSLRKYMFSSVIKKKYSDITTHHSGDLLNRMTSDIDTVVNGSVTIVPSIVSMATKIVAGIAVLLIQNPYIAIFVVIAGFLPSTIGRMLSKKYKKLHKQVQKSEGETRSFIQESFENLIVIKTFFGAMPFSMKLDNLMKNNFIAKVKKSYSTVSISVCLRAVFTLGYYGVLIWGATQIATGKISYGTLIFFLQLVSILRVPLQNISGILPRQYAMNASAERLMEIDTLPAEADSFSKREQESLKNNFTNIKASNLNFSYGSKPVFNDLSFDIEKNSITAIVGHSGSGKTTFFKILLGLYELDSGSLKINNKFDVSPATRFMFSYVPQRNMTVSGTIRENLTLGDKNIDDEKIMQAIEIAVADKFINELPNGLDTVLAEHGAGLSEGQLQRLSVARALLFDAPIILLDESTSALDEETESQLLSNIKQITEKTVVFITHRNTSLKVCDNVITI